MVEQLELGLALVELLMVSLEHKRVTLKHTSLIGLDTSPYPLDLAWPIKARHFKHNNILKS